MYYRVPTRRAFSLIESIIVFAVVGLVLAGIWVAASAVSENRKITKATELAILLADGTQRILKGTVSATATIWLARDTDPSDKIVNFGFVPADAIVNAKLTDPWGNPMQVYVHGPSQTFTIAYRNVSKPVCMKLGRRLAGAGWRNFQKHATALYNQLSGSLVYTASTIQVAPPGDLYPESACPDDVVMFFTFPL